MDRRPAGRAADAGARRALPRVHRPRARRSASASVRRTNREATVWNVAVNGVMAGCRPEYMPVLLAVVEAMSTRFTDRGRRLDAGLGTADHRQRPDRQGTRFQLRAGRDARRPPGQHQHRPLPAPVPAQRRRLPHSARGARQGQHRPELSASRWPRTRTRSREIGWQPYSVDRGFKAGDNIVTVHSVVAISSPIYTGSENAVEHAGLIADVIGQRACGYWTAIGMVYATGIR